MFVRTLNVFSNKSQFFLNGSFKLQKTLFVVSATKNDRAVLTNMFPQTRFHKQASTNTFSQTRFHKRNCDCEHLFTKLMNGVYTFFGVCKNLKTNSLFKRLFVFKSFAQVVCGRFMEEWFVSRSVEGNNNKNNNKERKKERKKEINK